MQVRPKHCVMTLALLATAVQSFYATAADPKNVRKKGDYVYVNVCTACHTTGFMGAPMLGSAQDWKPRIAQGMDTLYTHAINGYNRMPARGGCTSCTDDDIKAAVNFIVSKAK